MPAYPAIFSCFLGAGVQLFMMFYFSMVAYVIFFSQQSLRPHIQTFVMVVLALMGFLNGLVTMRSLKFFGVTDWLFAATIASVSLPAFIYLCLGAETILYALAGGYTRNSLLMDLLYTVLWCLLNSACCFFGSYKGYMLS